MQKLQLLTLTGLLAFTSPAFAGTYANIAIDGSFSDWTSVPVLLTDPADSTAVDIGDVQIANDDTNLYLRISYNSPVNPNTPASIYLAFDVDKNLATGYDIYGLGTVGSDVGFQNDFPFAQAAGVFNTGVSLSAGALISPYNTTLTAQEYSIPRDLHVLPAGANLFGSGFNMMIWTDRGPVDVTAAISYDFASIPEPASLCLFGAILPLALRRRA